LNADPKEAVLSDILAAWPSVGDRVARAARIDEICVQVTDFLIQLLKVDVAACFLCFDGESVCHISGTTTPHEMIRRSVLDAWRNTTGLIMAEADIDWVSAGLPDCAAAANPAGIASKPIFSGGVPRGLVLSNAEEGANNKLQAVSALLGPSLTALERLRHEARRDPLTGIPNRGAFEESLDRQLRLARRHETPVSILLLDVNRFKEVNDTFGHPAGDSVLRTLAERVLETIRETDLFCRFGGDEFALLLPQTDRDGAAVAARRISETLRNKPAELGSQQIPLSAGIGIGAWKPGDPEPDMDRILAQADRDLYRKKSTVGDASG
jgi:diguanylate cyclase (GGDEF)-like protein